MSRIAPITPQPASETVTGSVELATDAETTTGTATDKVTTPANIQALQASAANINTGTDAKQVIAPDALAGSNYGTAIVPILVFDETTDTATGDYAGGVFWSVPAELNGWNLVDVSVAAMDLGTTGAMSVQVHNMRSHATTGVDMLSTLVTLAAAEYDVADGVVNGSNDALVTGDRLRIDIDAVCTTPHKGLLVNLHCRLP